jgi:hypothetical protein
MSTKDFDSHDWSSENGKATGLMKPGESITVSGPDGPHGIYDGSWIPDVQDISLDYTSFPDLLCTNIRVYPRTSPRGLKKGASPREWVCQCHRSRRRRVP